MEIEEVSNCEEAIDTDTTKLSLLTEKLNTFNWHATLRVNDVSHLNLKNASISLVTEFDKSQIHADMIAGDYPDGCKLRLMTEYGEPALTNEKKLEKEFKQKFFFPI